MEQQKTKRCPYCGEEILAVAKKCKHCGEWFVDEGPVQGAAHESATPTSIAHIKDKSSNLSKELCDYNEYYKQTSGIFYTLVIGAILSFIGFCYEMSPDASGGLVGAAVKIGKHLPTTIGDILESFGMVFLLCYFGYALQKMNKTTNGHKSTLPIVIFTIAGLEAIIFVCTIFCDNSIGAIFQLIALPIVGFAGFDLLASYTGNTKKVGVGFLLDAVASILLLALVYFKLFNGEGNISIVVVPYLLAVGVEIYAFYTVKVALTSKSEQQ